MSEAQTDTMEYEEDTPQETAVSEQDALDARIDQHIADVQASRSAKQRRGEYIKFGILAVILVGTVVVIALLQPLIFNKLVPAIMGDGQPTATLVEEGSEPVKVEDEAMQESDTESAPMLEENSVDDAAEEEVAPTETDTDAATAPETETEGAVGGQPESEEAEPPAPTTYTVQVGDTLTSIAAKHNVSVDAIMQANGLQNPNSIVVGTILIIPNP